MNIIQYYNALLNTLPNAIANYVASQASQQGGMPSRYTNFKNIQVPDSMKKKLEKAAIPVSKEMKEMIVKDKKPRSKSVIYLMAGLGLLLDIM